MSRLTNALVLALVFIVLWPTAAWADFGYPVDPSVGSNNGTVTGSIVVRRPGSPGSHEQRPSNGSGKRTSTSGSQHPSTRSSRPSTGSRPAPWWTRYWTPEAWAEMAKGILEHRAGWLGMAVPRNDPPGVAGLRRGAGASGQNRPSRVEVQAVVGRAVARLRLPLPIPFIGPDPSKNEWHAAAVGYPLWLWTEQHDVQRASASVMGVTISLTATPGPVTFVMGDGTSHTCAKTTPYPASVKPGTPSPTCGHVYKEPGRYTVTATQTWEVTWTAAGFAGSLNVERTASTSLTVVELVSVLVR